MVDSCDSAWTNSVGTASTSTTAKVQGTGSQFFVTGGTGLIAYHATGTLNLSAYTGLQFFMEGSVVPLSPIAGQFSLALYSNNNGTGLLESYQVNDGYRSGWCAMYAPFLNPAALTAVKSIGLICNYTIGGAAIAAMDWVSAVSAVNVPLLWPRGVDDVDDLRPHPGIDQLDLQGGRRQLINSLARRISVQSAPMLTKADRVWMGTVFNLASDKKLVYASEEVPVVWKNGQQPFASAWALNSENARQYLLEFDEQTTWTTAPLSYTQ